MTSSLPDFSSNPVNAPAADNASLAALFPAAGSAAGSATAPVPLFDTLLGASASSGVTPELAAPSGANPESCPAPEPGQTSIAVTLPDFPAGVRNSANAPTRMLLNPLPAAAASESANPREQAMLVLGMKFTPTVTNPEDPAAVEPVAKTTGPDGRREITRATLEEAVTFVTSLLQAALPEIMLPEFSGLTDALGQPATGAKGNPGSMVLPDSSELTTSTTPAATVAPSGKDQPIHPVFTLATDGAIELKLNLAALKPADFKLKFPSDQPVTIQAEMQKPGEVMVRFEAADLEPASGTGSSGSADPGKLNSPRPSGRAIFAANFPGLKITLASTEQSGERNFVFTGDKQVKSPSPVAGISVAKTETTMPVAPTEEPRFTRNPEPFSVLPQRVDFQVVVPPAERITVPAAAPAGQNFAERAVDTVTSLVETQFSASMQKSGSVQLRLRFGGEDLSVRVEIRDGAVHTDFRTNSPELRSALSREWQAVAEQSPEQMARYLEPVFSPTPSSVPAATDTPSFFARQQQQSHQDLPSRTPREPWAEPSSLFSRRSQLSDSFVPEPAVTRGPAFLPTSLRLSVHA